MSQTVECATSNCCRLRNNIYIYTYMFAQGNRGSGPEKLFQHFPGTRQVRLVWQVAVVWPMWQVPSGRCGDVASVAGMTDAASAPGVAGAARVASAAGLAARGIIWLPETSHMASYCCWQAALWYHMAARDKPYGIIGGYGSRMFLLLFHNAWRAVLETLVQYRPACPRCAPFTGGYRGRMFLSHYHNA